jgi:hypothetical protein
MSTDIEYTAPSTSTQSEKAKAKRAERNRLFYLKKKASEAMFEGGAVPASVKKVARKIDPKITNKFREDAVLIQADLTALIARICVLADAVHSVYHPPADAEPEPEPVPEPVPEPEVVYEAPKKEKKAKKSKTEKLPK